MYHVNDCLVVLGRTDPRRPPLTSSAATVTSGVAQFDSTKYPKRTLPMIAPSLEAASVIAIPVALLKIDFWIRTVLLLTPK